MKKSVLATFAFSFLLVPITAQTALRTVRVASGLTRPVDVQAPKGDKDRIFIVEQGGLIRIVKDGKILATPFLDVRSSVTCCGERGLLGLAFHPDFANNGHFFINYTAGFPLGTYVARYTVSSTNPDVANPASRKAIIGPINQPYSNHNGGQIQFGKDGYLYIGMGDGGSRGDPGCRAQNMQSLHGKMLRIDVNTTTGGYTIPASNPFAKSTTARREIWALGLRNPWRFCIDPKNGDMYIGDVGQGAREEISFQPGTSKGGENYGWKIMEGNLCYSTAACATTLPSCNNAAYTKPILDYNRTTGRSITGGYVYRGCAIPDLAGTYFYGDYATKRIWSFRYANGKLTDFKDRTSELSWTGAVSSFGVDGCGEIYVCAYTSWSGGSSVYKIVPNAPSPVVDLGYGKVGSNNKIPRFDACGLLTKGSSAEFRLVDAPASALSLLMISTSSNPTAIFGGTVVPLPVTIQAIVATNAEGKVSFNAAGGAGKYSLYAQFLILDAKASFGIGISNALRVDMQN